MDQQLDLDELKNMLENPKLLDVYVNIINKKQPNFFDQETTKETLHFIDLEFNEFNQEQRLKENDNLKSKKRLKLQEEFKQSELKHLLKQQKLEQTTTSSSTTTTMKSNQLVKKSNYLPDSKTTKKVIIFNTRTTKRPIVSRYQLSTKESSKQILERLLKSKKTIE